MWIVALLCLLEVEGVRGAYNCSRSHILDTTADDFYKNLKEGCNNLRVYLYKQTDRKMNVTATSDETELNVYVWGGCDPDGDFYMCRDCIDSQCENLFDLCGKSSWGELNFVIDEKVVCFVHYNGIDYKQPDDAPATLIQPYRQSLLFFLLRHLYLVLLIT